MTTRSSGRWRRLLLGRPRDLRDDRLFHRLSLVPFLAWVGLGADGLSSSAYGPEEAFKALRGNTYLAVALAGLMAATVLLIAAAYRRIIEEFPTGGGGYVVASKLLGRRIGVVSGAALLVDYVLTITVSIAAAGDALFSFLPPEWASAKLAIEAALIGGLVVMNLRGVRESVLLLLPVFLLFLVTHAVVIVGGLVAHGATLTATTTEVTQGYARGWRELGAGGMLLLFVRAYSLGGGTYTGIEAVSNGLPIMRDPKVRTAKRTMVYMAASLAFTATGLLLCYLLWHLEPVPGKTMNAALVERLVAGVPAGSAFVVAFLFSEAMLLVVAAQAGFLDGPRVLANMAIDSWAPHRFAALSERLTAHNGILLMGAAALAALVYTGGAVSHLVVMYAINVFLTFSLSMVAMLRFWIGRNGKGRPERPRRVALFAAGMILCSTILVITVIEKFTEGGWITVAITAVVLVGAFLVERHYRRMAGRMDALHRELGDLPARSAERSPTPFGPGPTAAVLVGSYGGVGIHTLLNLFRSFPGQYRQVVFLSVGVIDSGEFKGEHGLDELRERTEEMLRRYVRLAHDLGVAAEWRMRIGTDLVAEAEELCAEAARDFPRVTFFAGKLVFGRERWYHRLLHNETAAAIQRRLQWAGQVMVMLPVRVKAVAPVIIAMLLAREATAQATARDSAAARRPPFGFADFSWLNGTTRQRESVLDSKYVTGEFRADVTYIHQFHRPADHTLVGSSESGRTSEIQVQQLGIGGDFHAGRARGRIMTQFGMYSTMTPRNDASPGRGQWNLADAYRYLSEAYGGYHWDRWRGINLDAGIFMSYVGLFSYYNFDNWAYQPSYVSSNTPWFFNGIRIQVFPTERLKLEPWIVNGWQAYGRFNSAPGLGLQVLWRPNGSISILGNQYWGRDWLGIPGRWRLHSDNSLQVKYLDRPGRAIARGAFSLTIDVGCEQGDGVSCRKGSAAQPAQNFVGVMAYNRLWLRGDQVALTVGGGAMSNPGRYLVLLPPINGATAFSGTPYFTTNPGDPFTAWDLSFTVDYMPDSFATFRIEGNHRHASVPYFAGPGGVTPAGGNVGAPGSVVPGFVPDLRKSENRLTAALLIKL